MVLIKLFRWTFELPLSTTWPTPLPKSKEAGWHYSTVTIVVSVIVGAIFILCICIYVFVAEAMKSRRRFAIPDFPATVTDRRKKIKRQKSRKGSKQRMTKAQRLLEVNRKWSEIYCSENSDDEEPEDSATVPFGSLEITGPKKVRFRNSIQDVYFIESKEEMKRLEKLQSLGFDVTIKRPRPSARDYACKETIKTAVCEEKETAWTPADLCSTINDFINKTEEPDISSRVLKKWVNATNFQIQDAKTSNKQVWFKNRIFKDEERLLEIPSFRESSV